MKEESMTICESCKLNMINGQTGISEMIDKNILKIRKAFHLEMLKFAEEEKKLIVISYDKLNYLAEKIIEIIMEE